MVLLQTIILKGLEAVLLFQRYTNMDSSMVLLQNSTQALIHLWWGNLVSASSKPVRNSLNKCMLYSSNTFLVKYNCFIGRIYQRQNINSIMYVTNDPIILLYFRYEITGYKLLGILGLCVAFHRYFLSLNITCICTQKVVVLIQ